jgi:DNA-binding winged helix-turn-helix (wHTH) protein
VTRYRSSQTAAERTLEFGRFCVLLRQRQLVADGRPIELGTRALDLLLILLEADGELVTKDELLCRVWPGIVVAEENLKVQISALRKALGEDRDFIRTDFGRGYRFTAAVRSAVTWGACQWPTRRGQRSTQISIPRWASQRPPHDRCVSKSR